MNKSKSIIFNSSFESWLYDHNINKYDWDYIVNEPGLAFLKAGNRYFVHQYHDTKEIPEGQGVSFIEKIMTMNALESADYLRKKIPEFKSVFTLSY